MNMILVQNEFILENLFLDDIDTYLRNGLTFKPFWIRDKEILLKKTDDRVSLFVIKTVERDIKITTDDTMEANKEALEDIESYLQICSLMTSSNSTARHIATSNLSSLDEAFISVLSNFPVKVIQPSIEQPITEAGKEKVNLYFPIYLQKTKILYNKYSPLLS